jgi:hypothetical protein
MIKVVTEEMDGSDRVSFDLKRLRASLGLSNGNSSTRAKERALRSAEGSVLEKCLTSVDIVGDGRLT